MKNFAVTVLFGLALTASANDRTSLVDAEEEAAAIARYTEHTRERALLRPGCKCPHGTVDKNAICTDDAHDGIACFECDKTDGAVHNLIAKTDGTSYCTPAIFPCSCKGGTLDTTAVCHSENQQACTACDSDSTHKLTPGAEGLSFCSDAIYDCTCRNGVAAPRCSLKDHSACETCEDGYALTLMSNGLFYCHNVGDKCMPKYCNQWDCKGVEAFSPSWCTCWNSNVNYADFGCEDDGDVEGACQCDNAGVMLA
jgi:hypothetical protein